MKAGIVLTLLGLAAVGMTSTHLSVRDDNNGGIKRLLVGAPNAILAVHFSGNNFTVVDSLENIDLTPSWLLFKSPDTIYGADSLSKKLSVFRHNPSDGGIELVQNKTGSDGVVHLETNKDKTRLLASAYTEGIVQVWDIEDDKDPKELWKLNPSDMEGFNHSESSPHQTVRHPEEDWFVVNDLAADSMHIIDGRDKDKFKLIRSVDVADGCGPRHGVFHTTDEDSYWYSLVCEKSNMVVLYEVTINGDSFELVSRHRISTFDPVHPPEDQETVAAGAIVAAKDGRHLYISNRKMGGAQDSISRIGTSGGTIEYLDRFSSKADSPEMMSLSLDQTVLFVANDGNPEGLHAFQRRTSGEMSGEIDGSPLGHADLRNNLGDESPGPQFVSEVAVGDNTASSASSSPTDDSDE